MLIDTPYEELDRWDDRNLIAGLGASSPTRRNWPASAGSAATSSPRSADVSRYLELCTLGDLPPRQGVPAGVIMAGMVPVTRLFADQDGHARFEDVEIPLAPDDPPPDAMSISQPWQASAVLFGRGPAGGSHAEQPEQRRQLVVGISGRVEVTASGETRAFGPGDVLLVEDTEGFGHSSQSAEGFLAAFVVLEA